MKTPIITRKIDLARAQAQNVREILRREWLITNGLGGYGSGTISGMVSRRYHGLLVAALPAPFGRVVMLNHLAETLRLPDGRRVLIGGEEPSASDDPDAVEHAVQEFRLEEGLPIWRFESGGVTIEKRLLLVHGQNTLHVTYTLLSAQDSVRLDLQPSLQFRLHENDVAKPLPGEYSLLIRDRRYEVALADFPHVLRLYIHDDCTAYTHEGRRPRDISYPTEEDRGYQSRGLLWSPGHFNIELRPNRPLTLVASTEEWPAILAINPETALASEMARRQRLLESAAPSTRGTPAAELVLAADQFIITPAGRVEDAARAKASGDEVRTVIAG